MTKVKNCKINTTYKDANEFNAIDIAKFVAAILVVSIHVDTFFANGNPLLESVNFFIENVIGRLAVPFFFTCSGFFIFRKTNEKNLNVEPIKKHLKKLLKLYILWSIIYFPINFSYESANGFFDRVLCFFRDLCLSTIFGVGGYNHLWYLAASIFAIFILTLMIKKKINLKWIVIIAFVLYLVSVAGNAWYGFVFYMDFFPSCFSDAKEFHGFIAEKTRSGLFFGLMFMSIGTVFAYKNVNLSRRKSLIGFFVSFILMIIETYFVKLNGLANEHESSLFLLPTSFFLFSLIVNIRIEGKKQIFKNLRILSSLIYFSHFWIRYFFQEGIYHTLSYQYFLYTFIPYGVFEKWLFPIVLIISICLSLAVIWLSKKKGFRWLKHLYS